MGTGSSPGVKCGRGMLLTAHPLLVPQSWRSRAIPLPTLWATTGPVTGSLYLLPVFYYIQRYVFYCDTLKMLGTLGFGYPVM